MNRPSDGSRELEALQSIAENLEDIAKALFEIRNELRTHHPAPRRKRTLAPIGAPALDNEDER